MTEFSKRATVYFEPALHQALRLKAAETSRSISDLVNDAVREELAEDATDLAGLRERKDEPTQSFEAFVKELRRDGTL